MAVQFQVRRGTATEWAATPVTLALGEFGFDTTNKLLKIGDGSLTFSALSDLRATGVIPSGGNDGQGLIKSGTTLAWADYVSSPTNNPSGGATLVRNSGNTANLWATGTGLGTLTGLVSTSPLTINGTVGGSYTSGSATIGLNASALNTFLSNLSGTVAYANTATTLDLGTSANTLNLGTSATTLNLGTSQYSGGVTLNLGYLNSYGTTSTININTAAASSYSASVSASYTSRITNISTGSLNNGTDGDSDGAYALTNAQVNIGNSKANSAANITAGGYDFVHITNIYGNLKLPQWVSGALVTDANGLVGKQTVASANTNSAIVARDESGGFSAGTISATTFSGSGSGLTGVPNSATTATYLNNISTIVARDGSGNFNAGTITATTVSANTLTGAHDAASLTGTLNIARIAQNAITGGATGKIALTTIDNNNIAAAAGILDTKLATISTPLKVSNSATTANSLNTNGAIVARDGSGGFSAGTISAAAVSVTGNLNLPQLVSGALVTDANGLVGKQTVTSANTNGAIVARDGSGTITATSFSGSGSGLTAIPGANITTNTIPIKAINNDGAIVQVSGGNYSIALGVKYIIVNATDVNCALYLGNLQLDGYSITVVNRAAANSSIGQVSNSTVGDTQAVYNIYSKLTTAGVLNTPGNTILLGTPGAWVKLVYKGTGTYQGWYVMASS